MGVLMGDEERSGSLAGNIATALATLALIVGISYGVSEGVRKTIGRTDYTPKNWVTVRLGTCGDQMPNSTEAILDTSNYDGNRGALIDQIEDENKKYNPKFSMNGIQNPGTPVRVPEALLGQRYKDCIDR